MNGVLDLALVGALLCASLGYAAFSLGPRALRARLKSMAGAVLGKSIARRLGVDAALETKAGCGGCHNCGSEQSPAAHSAAGDVKIPLSRIGGRRGAERR